MREVADAEVVERERRVDVEKWLHRPDCIRASVRIKEHGRNGYMQHLRAGAYSDHSTTIIPTASHSHAG